MGGFGVAAVLAAGAWLVHEWTGAEKAGGVAAEKAGNATSKVLLVGAVAGGVYLYGKRKRAW